MHRKTNSRVIIHIVVVGVVVSLLSGCNREHSVPHLDQLMNDDKYLWLEEIESKRSMDWVREQNAKTLRRFSTSASFTDLQTKILAALDSKDRIPSVSSCAGYLYNYWVDESNPKGILRRTTWEEYPKAQPAWETVIDIDALAESENENWVYRGIMFLYPDCQRGLLALSRGGGDAVVTREYDIEKKHIIEDGFHVPLAKSDVYWAGPDRLFVATDFGEGTLSESGYPITVRAWNRGENLDDAEVLYEGEKTDLSVGAFASAVSGYRDVSVMRNIDFYNHERFVLRNGSLVKIDLPLDVSSAIRLQVMVIALESDWRVGDKTYRGGSLLATLLDDFLAGARDLQVLFEPTATSALVSFNFTASHILINTIDNVLTRNFIATHSDGSWEVNELERSNPTDHTSIYPVSSLDDDRYFSRNEGFVQPSTLSIGSVGGELVKLKSAPTFFDASGIHSLQHWAVSADGTSIPYFVVCRDEVEQGPTILYGYGGFRASMLPGYSAANGLGWLERGGTYAFANIRGGGEFGPQWHEAALKENRNKAYEDFIAVAEDLIARGYTTPRQLGIMGGSNGGLLMGNMLTSRPDLFGAIVAQVPLFDMSRYHKLLAGASWIAEYGNPDNPEEWEYLQRYSPYHNLQDGIEYPPLLVTTSTQDDRVHPGHARKMAAKLLDMGQNVHYYENIEGGHAGAADNSQRAFASTLEHEFMWATLNEEAKNPEGE